MDYLKNLEEASKKEKNVRIHTRMLAVLMVHIYEMPQNKVAMILGMTSRCVSKWVKRFDNGGVDALSDLPHSGSPPKADQEMIQSIVRKEEKGFKTLPVSVKQEIQEQTGVSHHITHV